MTCEFLVFPSYKRMMQVRQDRLDAGADALSKYLVISSGDIVVGGQSLADVIDLDVERENRKS